MDRMLSGPTWAELVSRACLSGDRAAVVLLSGGMDSTAALHMAVECYHPRGRITALVVDYGQPHGGCEIPYAQVAADRLDVRAERICVADALRALRPAERMANAPHAAGGGAHPATVPGRNLLLLSLAAAHGSVWYPGMPLDVWIGACADDAAGFADCHPDFMAQASVALTYGCGGNVRVVAPLLRVTKRQSVEAAKARPDALEAMAQSWSCYRGGDVSCGTCTPCVLRADAFAAAGVADRPLKLAAFGGDPAREIGRH